MLVQRLILPLKMFDKNMQKIISKKYFIQEPSGLYQGSLYQPVINGSPVNSGWRQANKQKDSGKTIKTVAALAGFTLSTTVTKH